MSCRSQMCGRTLRLVCFNNYGHVAYMIKVTMVLHWY